MSIDRPNMPESIWNMGFSKEDILSMMIPYNPDKIKTDNLFREILLSEDIIRADDRMIKICPIYSDMKENRTGVIIVNTPRSIKDSTKPAMLPSTVRKTA